MGFDAISWDFMEMAENRGFFERAFLDLFLSCSRGNLWISL
jgi:hypothetical protein